MSRIAELIEELCPEGVNYSELSILADYSNEKISSKNIKENEYIGVENLNSNFSGYHLTGKPDKEVRLNKFNPGSILLGNIRPYLKKMVMVDFGGAASPDVLVIDVKPECRGKLKPNFLYYILTMGDFVSYNIANSRGGKMPRGDKKAIMNYRIPVPPLEVQEEIVRILDRFTLLEAELEAELEARRKQYAHFRDSLLDRNEMKSSQVVKLKEVCDFEYGLTETAKSEGPVRFIRITDIDENGHLKKDSLAYVEDTPDSRRKRLCSGDVVVARTGASFGKSLYFDNPIDASYASFLIKITCRNGVLNGKYLWHFMQSSYYWKQAEILVSRGGQPQFNSNAISRVKIPFPDMKRQKEIVILLDKFDALVNDISSGLPAEIAARRKQYEYYRDQLLTFKELQPEAA